MSTSDNVQDVGPDEFPLYENTREEVVQKDTSKVKATGASSMQDADAVDGLQTSSPVAPSPNSLVPLDKNKQMSLGVTLYPAMIGMLFGK